MLTVINRQYKDHLGRLITGNMPIANQGDGAYYILDYEVYFGGNFSYNLSFSTSAGSPIITLNGANWSDFGISSGDTISFIAINNATNDAPFTADKVVNLVNGNQMTIAAAWSSSQMYVSGEFYVDKSPEAVKSSINLIPNTQNSGLASFIDNSVVSLVNDDISGMAVNDVLPLNVEGDLSGSAILQSTIERLADRKGGRAKAYRLEIQYINWLYLSRFAPMFFSNECTTPFVSTSFLPLWNNPAVALSSSFKLENDGNSGFRDENFNGNVDNFKVLSMAWEDADGYSIGGIDYADESFFRLQIENVAGGGFGSEVGLILFNDIEDESVYSADVLNNNGDYSHLNHTLFTQKHDIPSNGTPTIINGNIGLNGEQLIVEVTATVSGNVITYEGKVTPNAAFTANFASSNNKRFVMLARVESASFGASNYSDTVNKTAWIGEVEDYPPVLGNYYTNIVVNDHANNQI